MHLSLTQSSPSLKHIWSIVFQALLNHNKPTIPPPPFLTLVRQMPVVVLHIIYNLNATAIMCFNTHIQQSPKENALMFPLVSQLLFIILTTKYSFIVQGFA